AAEGTDVLLMAADHALRRELSRRVRDDLIRLGIVQNAPAVTIADGATASPGDLIICTRNDHATEAGEPGRTLANGDLLRIEAVTKEGLLVRPALDADPATRQPRSTGRSPRATRPPAWAPPPPPSAPGPAPAPPASPVFCAPEPRQPAYAALPRGTPPNMPYVFPRSPKRAAPAPAPRPAPELARYDQN